MKLFNLFKKKKQTQKNSIAENNKYNVVLMEVFADDITKEIGVLTCEKVRDRDDGLVYLEDKEGEFKEFFPTEDNTSKGYSIESAEKELKNLKSKPLKKLENPISKQKKIDKLEKIIKALQTKGGSFFYFDKSGIPTIEYVRLNSVFIPLKRYLKLNQITLPQEYQTKNIIKAIEEKKEKYKSNIDKWSSLIQTMGWLLVIIMIGMNIYWSNYNMTWTDSTSNIAKLQNRIDQTPLLCAEMLGQSANNFLEASKQAKTNTELINSKLNNTKIKAKAPPQQLIPIKTITG